MEDKRVAIYDVIFAGIIHHNTHELPVGLSPLYGRKPVSRAEEARFLRK